MSNIIIGNKYCFAYPIEFVTLPDYTEHANQIVTAIREMIDGVEYDRPWDEKVPEELTDRAFEIKALDGWEGMAWESELEEMN